MVDLELGVLMNQDGQVLQDSQGKPKRVVLGEDGRTIFGDMLQSVLLNIYTMEMEIYIRRIKVSHPSYCYCYFIWNG